MLVQVNRDLDLVLVGFLLELVNMNPLEVNMRQVSTNLLGHLEFSILSSILCTLHSEPSQNETLVILGEFFFF